MAYFQRYLSNNMKKEFKDGDSEEIEEIDFNKYDSTDLYPTSINFFIPGNKKVSKKLKSKKINQKPKKNAIKTFPLPVCTCKLPNSNNQKNYDNKMLNRYITYCPICLYENTLYKDNLSFQTEIENSSYDSDLITKRGYINQNNNRSIGNLKDIREIQYITKKLPRLNRREKPYDNEGIYIIPYKRNSPPYFDMKVDSGSFEPNNHLEDNKIILNDKSVAKITNDNEKINYSQIEHNIKDNSQFSYINNFNYYNKDILNKRKYKYNNIPFVKQKTNNFIIDNEVIPKEKLKFSEKKDSIINNKYLKKDNENNNQKKFYKKNNIDEQNKNEYLNINVINENTKKIWTQGNNSVPENNIIFDRIENNIVPSENSEEKIKLRKENNKEKLNYIINEVKKENNEKYSNINEKNTDIQKQNEENELNKNLNKQDIIDENDINNKKNENNNLYEKIVYNKDDITNEKTKNLNDKIDYKEENIISENELEKNMVHKKEDLTNKIFGKEKGGEIDEIQDEQNNKNVDSKDYKENFDESEEKNYNLKKNEIFEDNSIKQNQEKYISIKQNEIKLINDKIEEVNKNLEEEHNLDNLYNEEKEKNEELNLIYDEKSFDKNNKNEINYENLNSQKEENQIVLNNKDKKNYEDKNKEIKPYPLIKPKIDKEMNNNIDFKKEIKANNDKLNSNEFSNALKKTIISQNNNLKKKLHYSKELLFNPKANKSKNIIPLFSKYEQLGEKGKYEYSKKNNEPDEFIFKKTNEIFPSKFGIEMPYKSKFKQNDNMIKKINNSDKKLEKNYTNKNLSDKKKSNTIDIDSGKKKKEEYNFEEKFSKTENNNKKYCHFNKNNIQNKNPFLGFSSYDINSKERKNLILKTVQKEENAFNNIISLEDNILKKRELTEKELNQFIIIFTNYLFETEDNNSDNKTIYEFKINKVSNIIKNMKEDEQKKILENMEKNTKDEYTKELFIRLKNKIDDFKEKISKTYKNEINSEDENF